MQPPLAGNVAQGIAAFVAECRSIGHSANAHTVENDPDNTAKGRFHGFLIGRRQLCPKPSLILFRFRNSRHLLWNVARELVLQTSSPVASKVHKRGTGRNAFEQRHKLLWGG